MMRIAKTLCALTLLLSPTVGHAASATGNFNVTISITSTCTVTNPQNMAFGSTGLLTTALNQSSTFEVTCTNSTPYTIGLDGGQNQSGSQRRMLGGVSNNEYVSYNLYKDSAYSVPWLNSGGGLVNSTGTGSIQTFTVYGQVPVQPTPSAGSNYIDTVAITVVY